jgi:tryptophan synthase beta chain
VKFIGVEAAGQGLLSGRHSATLATGRPGVLHGTMSYLMEDENGQIEETHSIAPGLDYPGVGPEHSFYKDSRRAEYVSVTDAEALEGFRLLCETEGIIPALESAHAVYYAAKLAAGLPREQLIIVNLSGRGDKDLDIVTRALEMQP